MSETLHGLGQSALNNASEQERVSGVVGGGGSSGGVGGIPPDRAAELRAEVAALENPKAVNDWWNGLTQAEKRALLESDPNLIGNLDGIPPGVRYEANRNSIEAYVAEMEARRSELAANPPTFGTAGPVGDNYTTWRAELDALDAKIAKFEALGSEHNQILLFDPSGDGRIAQVFGDLSKASRVSVVVPGVSNDMDNFSSENAWNLYQATGGSDGDTATIQWLGYDTPPGLEPGAFTDWSVRNAGRAVEEAERLVALTQGIAANTGASITIVPHSYGTVLTAEAARAGLQVDKVVLLGSPGIPADNASVFNGADTYAIANDFDAIAYSGVHGTNPIDPAFGATVLEGNSSGPTLRGHSTYFDPNSQSLRSITLAIESPVERGDGMLEYVRVEDGVVIKTSVARY